ncbi:hypothetical protein B0H10DRAFT_1957913 [Mycena sp. CBHHK59/15]|nr:hypothetical protein B0H10DRAFT_1957913 [Mycena sp. CBHHK59/15]
MCPARPDAENDALIVSRESVFVKEGVEGAAKGDGYDGEARTFQYNMREDHVGELLGKTEVHPRFLRNAQRSYSHFKSCSEYWINGIGKRSPISTVTLRQQIQLRRFRIDRSFNALIIMAVSPNQRELEARGHAGNELDSVRAVVLVVEITDGGMAAFGNSAPSRTSIKFGIPRRKEKEASSQRNRAPAVPKIIQQRVARRRRVRAHTGNLETTSARTVTAQIVSVFKLELTTGDG